MIKYNNCRWSKPGDLERMCLNFAVDLVNVDDGDCMECSHFYSYLDNENVKIIDEDTESLLSAD